MLGVSVFVYFIGFLYFLVVVFLVFSILCCEGFDSKKKTYLGRDEYGRMGYFESDKDEVGNFVDILVEKANGVSLIGKKV